MMTFIPFLSTYRAIGLTTAMLLSASAALAPSAVVIEIDAVALRRDAPDLIEHVGQRPEAARMRQMLISRYGFDPRRDVAHVTIEGEGLGHSPVLHLVGCPAAAMAADLAKTGAGEHAAAGLLYATLNPGMGFIALDNDEALVGPLEALRAHAAVAANQAAVPATIDVQWTPGAQARAQFENITGAHLTSDGKGAVQVVATATDVAAAKELERRFQKLREMIDVGAAGKLPRAELAKSILDSGTLVRDGATLRFNATVPAEVRSALLARLDTVSGKG